MSSTRRRRCVCLSMALAALAVGGAACQPARQAGPQESAAARLPPGLYVYRAAVLDADGRRLGEVDWATQVLHVRTEAADTPAAQQDLRAQAVAAALAVDIDVLGPVRRLPNAPARVQAWVADLPIETLPAKGVSELALALPLTGPRSLAGLFYDDAKAQAAALKLASATWNEPPAKHDRWNEVYAPPAPRDQVLIIDARGTGVRPVVFPLMVNADSQILCDLNWIPREVSTVHGMCRWATTRESFEQLQASAGPGVRVVRAPALAFGPAGGLGNVDGVALEKLILAQAVPAAQSQPAAEAPPPAPARRRLVVPAEKAPGAAGNTIQIPAAPARQLQQSREAYGMMKNGQVIVIVDAAAAGLEGRRDAEPARFAAR